MAGSWRGMLGKHRRCIFHKTKVAFIRLQATRENSAFLLREENLALPVLLTGYFLAGKLGLQMAFVHANATAVWPPTGIALAGLLIFGYRMCPAIFLGAFLVNITTSSSASASISGDAEGLAATFLTNITTAG